MTASERIRAAREEQTRQIETVGREHGLAAASWYFDGNTTDETYRAVLKGIEDGDSAVLDTFPAEPLSGEWADDPTPNTLQHEFGIRDEDLDDACTAYEDAFHTAVEEEIERVARLQTA